MSVRCRTDGGSAAVQTRRMMTQQEIPAAEYPIARLPTMNPIASFLVFACLAAGAASVYWIGVFAAAAWFVLAILVALSVRMANVWEKFVILRMGKLQSVKGRRPVSDHSDHRRVIAVIDGRIQTTAFNAEQALTRDTVPVNVDAIIFWRVPTPRRRRWPSPITARRSTALRRPRCAR